MAGVFRSLFVLTLHPKEMGGVYDKLGIWKRVRRSDNKGPPGTSLF
ncbi:hypothetical protein SAMN04488072_11167 [Lentibacillus halodurans]|uniref:Uncharacterized protein n=1 Tax=Lentibacillus halodurans TaxID=237679 RepID=A0A1I0ZHQ2_9BACI|nr:hypothetical protein SAMN04488072_11167 [Lentibacillus halodurans]